MVQEMKFSTFTLDNGLQVLAISDPRFVKSSAALAVMAGSMQNPKNHLGLAHFLEHMLFLGTEDYPQVGEYEDYLNKNGGGHNAYTSIDHTNYFFDVTHSAFEGALKRFSRFFVNPTFDEKYVEREKNAVHSEHEKNLQDDYRREYRFLQMITDPNHPFSFFATGDKDTLSKADRNIVMDFYKSHYSSNLMRLVLMSPLDGNDLKKLAQSYFSDIKNHQLAEPHYEDQLFVEKNLPKLYQVQSVRDHDYLKMSFDLPDDMPFWESKPTQFLAHLVGDEGEGSLLSYLKKQGWATGLETSTWWRMFHIRVHLTEKGIKASEEIMKATFSYLKLLKKEGLKKYIFDERKILAEVDLKNMEPKSSMGRASQFSAAMLYFPVESFLSHYYLYHKYSPEEFDKFLSYLRADNMQVTIFSKKEVNGETEPYYGIAYKAENFGPGFAEELKNQEILSDFKYPVANPYVPSQFDLIQPPKISEPQQELYKKFSKLYWQTDTDLGIPKASVSLSFISDVIHGKPENYLLAKLFCALKKEELNEWGYPVRLAGLSYNLTHGYNTITLDVSGYSHHLTDLLNNLIKDDKHSRRLDSVKIEPETFDEIKRKMKKNIINKEHDAAYQQLMYESGHFFSTAAVHRNEYVQGIDSISIEMVNDFAKKFFSKVAIRSYSYGNIDGQAVKPVIDGFFNQMQAEGFLEEEVEAFENKFLQLPGHKYAEVFSGPNNNNAQLTYYKAGEWSIENQAFVSVLAKLIEQPFFTELRTHQQLGYVVAAFSTSNNGFSGIGTLIQSQSHEALDCFNRAHQFLHDLLVTMKTDLVAEDVELVKESLLSEIEQIPNSLRERLGRFTAMAGTYHGDFQFFAKLSQSLRSISLDRLKAFIDQSLQIDQEGHGALCFLYNGSHLMSSKVPQGFEKIKSYQEVMNEWPKIQPYKTPK